MAQLYYPYTSEGGQSFWVLAEENIMNVYESIVKEANTPSPVAATLPASKAALEEGDVELPASIQPRGLLLQIPGFGQGFMPVLDNTPVIDEGEIVGLAFTTTIAELGIDVAPAEDELFPVQATLEGDLDVECIGYRGEARFSD